MPAAVALAVGALVFALVVFAGFALAAVFGIVSK